jgi:prepilin-type processing-associated H-X9-DG protein
MKTLIINDLPVTEELDRRAMSAVRGGTGLPYPGFDISKLVTSFMPQQFIGQTQTVLTQNGSNIAFADGLISRANVAPKQDARNVANLNFGSAGDLA